MMQDSQSYKTCCEPLVSFNPQHSLTQTHHHTHLTTMNFKTLIYAIPLLVVYSTMVVASSVNVPGLVQASMAENPEIVPNFCPVGRQCTSDRQCGSCSCNNFRGICQE
ncbi:hypothetical protein C8Q80DRAFT_1189858 [Daedaleopsis nitida]|nr:hypothetical protein C8Q80DRAFT_1189858 [Daedaleopsis nitida]